MDFSGNFFLKNKISVVFGHLAIGKYKHLYSAPVRIHLKLGRKKAIKVRRKGNGSVVFLFRALWLVVRHACSPAMLLLVLDMR